MQELIHLSLNKIIAFVKKKKRNKKNYDQTGSDNGLSNGWGVLRKSSPPHVALADAYCCHDESCCL